MAKEPLKSNDLKRPEGRPTKYRPEFCELVVKKMKQGAAIKELPYYLDCCLDTINEWRRVHPEFSLAIKKGEELSEAVWMVKGRRGLRDKQFNYVGWFMNMRNRFRWTNNPVESENKSPHEKYMEELKGLE